MDQVNDFLYVVPEAFDASVVEKIVGKVLECPYCKAQTTAMKGGEDGEDTGWVRTPLRQSEPRWICLGCCIDIYSTCISSKFESHPYLDIVEEVARVEKLSVKVARRVALEHQREIADELIYKGFAMQYSSVLTRIALALECC
jgi:hypothetical protein